MTVTDRGEERYRRFLKNFRQEHKIVVGWMASEGANKNHKDEPGMTVLHLANIHEFGTTKAGRNKNVTIPRRSVVADWTDQNQKAYARKLKEAEEAIIKQWLTGRRVYIGSKLNNLGLWIEGQMKKRARQGLKPRLSDATLGIKRTKSGRRAKGSGKIKRRNPLSKSGQYINSIVSRFFIVERD